MNKNKLFGICLMFLLALSLLAFAQDATDTSSSAASDSAASAGDSDVSSDVSIDKCVGFFGKIKCFLFGSTEARAGKGWFDREALAGQAPVVLEEDVITSSGPFTAEDFKNEQIKAQLKGKGITGTLDGKPGTFTLNTEGTKFFFQPDGGQKAEVYKTALGKTSFNPSALPPPAAPKAAAPTAVGKQTAQSYAYHTILGSSLYNEYYSKIDWSKVTQQNIDDKTFPLKGKGSIKMEDVGEFQKATVQVGGDSGKSKEILFKNGREVVSQTAKQKESGEFTVGGKAVALSGAALDDFTSADEFTYGKDGGDVYGKVSVENGVVTNTDIANEEQTIVDANTGETMQRSGDIYEKGDEGCSEDICFRANSGTLVDSRGKAYTMDYDYSGTGAGRTLTEIELYDRQGYRSAIQKADGTRITAHQDEKGKYTGKVIIEASPGAGADKTYIADVDDDGIVTSVTTQAVIDAQKSYDSAFSNYEKAVNTFGNVKQKWQQKFGSDFDSDVLLITSDDELTPEQQKAKTEILNARNAKDKADTDRKGAQGELNEEKGKVNEEEAKSLAKKSKDEISSVKDVTAGTRRAVGTALETIYAVTSNIRSYSALSNLLFGEMEGYQEWQRWADQSFAPLLSSQWAPSSFCETGARWNDIEPQGKAVIKTAAGTYQTVASIQMERSPETSPLLCYHNSDPEAEKEWICDKKQVCVDDEFCYADDDRDEEPDDDKPLEGYFYKITWGVSAPQDETYTVFKDENGVAVSFNVWIDNSIDDTSGLTSLGAVPLYNRAGDTIAPIKLENGDSDRDVMVKYSPKLYQEACIVWHQPPSSVGVQAREGAVAGIVEIPDICFPVVVSFEERLEWESGEEEGRSSSKVSDNKGELSRNTEW